MLHHFYALIGLGSLVPDKLLEWALNNATSVIVAPIIFWITQRLKKVSGWLDGQNAAVKQAFAMVIAFAAAGLWNTFKIGLCGDPTPCAVDDIRCADAVVCTLDKFDVNGLVTWAFAMATHGIVKARKDQRANKGT